MFATYNCVSFHFLKLDNDIFRIVGCSDFSFRVNMDFSSQLGHIYFSGDGTGTVISIYFKPYKFRRVPRSPITGEVFAFSDLFHITSTLAKRNCCPTPKKRFCYSRWLIAGHLLTSHWNVRERWRREYCLTSRRQGKDIEMEGYPISDSFAAHKILLMDWWRLHTRRPYRRWWELEGWKCSLSSG